MDHSGRHYVRPLLAGLPGLRLEPAAQPPVDAVEIDVNHGRDEQRQQLRDAEAADHGDAERLNQLGPAPAPIAIGSVPKIAATSSS